MIQKIKAIVAYFASKLIFLFDIKLIFHIYIMCLCVIEIFLSYGQIHYLSIFSKCLCACVRVCVCVCVFYILGVCERFHQKSARHFCTANKYLDINKKFGRFS